MKTVEQLADAACMQRVQDRWIANALDLTRFHDAAIAQYRESLLAGVGEPDYTDSALYEPTAYTRDKVAAAVAIEREWLRKCLLVMEREAKWAFDDLNEEPDVLNADIAALKEHLK